MPFPVPRHNISFTFAERLAALRFAFTRPQVTDKVASFEKAFADWVGTTFAFGFTTGSAALYHGVRCANLAPGDEIVIPEYEFYTVVETLRLCGLAVRFAKVDSDTGNVTLQSVKDAMTPKTKAVLVAHIHGLPCLDIAGIATMCKDKGVLLIEDCAHSLGAKIDGRMTGSFGDFAIFSFGDGKALVACGGGMVTTSDPELAVWIVKTQAGLEMPSIKSERSRFMQSVIKGLLSTRLGFALSLYAPAFIVSALFRVSLVDRLFPVGGQKLSSVPEPYNWKMTDATAAMAHVQFARLGILNKRRQDNAQAYRVDLKDVSTLRLQANPENVVHADLNFWVRAKDRDERSRKLLLNGVDLRKDYLMFYSEKKPDGEIPLDGFYLPNHPGISPATVKKICDLIKKYYDQKEL